MTSPYHMIVLDLDGTLTNAQKIITPRTLDALMRAQAAGLRVVLASGRPTHGIAPLADQLRLGDYGGFVLSYNGGKIIDWATRQVVYEQVLEADLPPQLYAYAQREGLIIVTYSDTEIVTESEPDAYLEEEMRINKMPVRRVDSFVEAVAQLGGTPTKCLMTGDPEHLVRLQTEMQAALSDRMEIFRSAPFFLELMPKGIDKALSLGRLLDHVGIAREACIACGDGFNDLSMIRFAGLGVAMANAEAEVRAAADHITASNEEDGVAEVVERFVLNA
ncbi:MAG: HAD family phosphatase [Bacteroidaceae bacterium]|nr:HAD family phosphatase [Bacteroidaceae bacterium]